MWRYACKSARILKKKVEVAGCPPSNPECDAVGSIFQPWRIVFFSLRVDVERTALYRKFRWRDASAWRSRQQPGVRLQDEGNVWSQRLLSQVDDAPQQSCGRPWSIFMVADVAETTPSENGAHHVWKPSTEDEEQKRGMHKEAPGCRSVTRGRGGRLKKIYYILCFEKLLLRPCSNVKCISGTSNTVGHLITYKRSHSAQLNRIFAVFVIVVHVLDKFHHNRMISLRWNHHKMKMRMRNFHPNWNSACMGLRYKRCAPANPGI